MAVAGGGTGVARTVGDPAGPVGSQRKGGAQRVGGRGGGESGVKYYSYGKQGHVRSACPMNGPRYYGCGVIGHLSYRCPGLSLPRMDADGRPVAQTARNGGSGVPALKRPASASVGGAKHTIERCGAPQGARANV